MFNTLRLWRSPFESGNPSTDSAIEHLRRYLAHSPRSPARHEDHMAVRYLCTPMSLKSPEIREILIRCLDLRTPGAPSDGGRIRGYPSIAACVLQCVHQHPKQFHEYGEKLISYLSNSDKRFVPLVLRVLEPLVRERWPKGLSVALGTILLDRELRLRALEFCGHSGTFAGEELEALRVPVGLAAGECLIGSTDVLERGHALIALGALGFVPEEIREQVERHRRHQSRFVRHSALVALASIGVSVSEQIEREIDEEGMLPEELVRAVVVEARFEPRARTLVSAMIAGEAGPPKLVLTLLRESLPEVRSMFVADITLVALATDSYPEELVALARDVLRSCGVEAEQGGGAREEDFFSLITSDSLRELAGVTPGLR